MRYSFIRLIAYALRYFRIALRPTTYKSSSFLWYAVRLFVRRWFPFHREVRKGIIREDLLQKKTTRNPVPRSISDNHNQTYDFDSSTRLWWTTDLGHRACTSKYRKQQTALPWPTSRQRITYGPTWGRPKIQPQLDEFVSHWTSMGLPWHKVTAAQCHSHVSYLETWLDYALALQHLSSLHWW